MLFKYFIKFDGDGEVECFCRTQPADCQTKCSNEYLMKLTLIQRSDTDDKIKDMDRVAENFLQSTKKLNATVKKVVKNFNRRLVK